MRARVATAARTGVAWSHGDYVDDLSSVAAAVCGPDGTAVAALYVYGPSYRFPDPTTIHEVEDTLRTHAARISAAWNARRQAGAA